MSQIIKDGTGTGINVKVLSDNRMCVDSVTRSHGEQGVLDGDSYNLNTGIVSLTSANKSAVAYIENTSDTSDIYIQTVIYIMGTSTNGSGDFLVTMLRNPTAGTIISTATDMEMAGINRNFGSANTITASMYKGTEGATFTSGDKIIETLFGGAPVRSAVITDTIILTKGTSIGIDITPPAGNTSMDLEVAFSVHTELTGVRNG